MRDQLDVVIPAHRKDFATLDIAAGCALRKLPELRDVFVVSSESYSSDSPRIHHVQEPRGTDFPVVDEIRARWEREYPPLASRAEWVYQQLLCLGATRYIAQLLPAYLCIDADTIFLRPVRFLFEGIRFVYCDSPQPPREPYAAAHRRLTGEEQLPRSFTSHHMLYDRTMLTELFLQIEELHGKPWYDAYVDCVDFSVGASINEQDTYGSWVVTHHPEAVLRRPLAWTEIRYVPNRWQRWRLSRRFDFVSAHAYMRQPLQRRIRQRTMETGGRFARRLPGVRRLLPARRNSVRP
jgi:hypothetical protein